MSNPYADQARAQRYAMLAIENTYYLAYRDLPKIFERYAMHGLALDHGCGTGRSTRLLTASGFTAIGVDISPAMIRQAHELDPMGDYRVIEPAKLTQFATAHFDLVQSVMPFESMASSQAQIETLLEIKRVLKPGGYKVLVATGHDVYLREYISFSSKDFPENGAAKAGDLVKVIINELGDGKAVEDYLWTEESYLHVFAEAGFDVIETYHPTASPDDDYQCDWVNERVYAPWLTFVLQKPA